MVYIDERGPLPDHTVYNIWECYAKLILEHYYPNVFKDIELVDKPDLYCKYNNIGIEVVKCDSKEKEEAVRLWSKMYTFDEEHKKRAIERMRQLGVEYQGWLQMWNPMDEGLQSDTFSCFLLAIQNKSKKLNSGNYKKYSHYHLFAISENIWICEEDCIGALKIIKEIIRNYNIKYQVIYLQAEKNLIEFDLFNNTYKFIKMGSFQYEVSDNARKMVIDKEKEMHPEDF